MKNAPVLSAPKHFVNQTQKKIMSYNSITLPVLPSSITASRSVLVPSMTHGSSIPELIEAFRRSGIDDCFTVIRSGGNPKSPDWKGWNKRGMSLDDIETVMDRGNHVNGYGPFPVSGWAIMPSFCSTIVVDVDGKSAVDWLISKGVWSDVEKVFDAGIVWTSGKPSRFSFLANIPTSHRVKNVARWSLHLDEGEQLELIGAQVGGYALLPGSLHSPGNQYRLVSAGTPVALSDAFWDAVLNDFPGSPVETVEAVDVEVVTALPRNVSVRVETVRKLFKSADDAYREEKETLPFICPCHDDNSPSAYINTINGGVHCSAGCSNTLLDVSLFDLAAKASLPWASYGKSRNRLSISQRNSSDNLAAAATGDLAALVSQVEMLTKTVSYLTSRLPRYSPMDEKVFAETFADDLNVFYDVSRKKFFIWTPQLSCYLMRDEEQIRGAIAVWSLTCPAIEGVASLSLQNSIYTWLTQDLSNRFNAEQMIELKAAPVPGSIERARYHSAFGYIFFENTVVSIDPDGSLVGLPHSPEYFNSRNIRITYEPDAGLHCGSTLAWLLDFCSGDKYKAAFLVAYMACCLRGIGCNIHQSYLMLYGQPGCGKSLLLDQLRSLVSRSGDYQLADFKASHGMQGMDTLDLIVFPDEAVKLYNNGNLLKITGGDPVMINPKNDPQFNYLHTGNLVITTNTADVVGNDQKGNIARRQQLVTVNAKPRWTENLIEKLNDERPALVNLLLSLDETSITAVVRDGIKLIPSMQRDVVEMKLEAGSSLETFIDENCEEMSVPPSHRRTDAAYIHEMFLKRFPGEMEHFPTPKSLGGEFKRLWTVVKGYEPETKGKGRGVYYPSIMLMDEPLPITSDAPVSGDRVSSDAALMDELVSIIFDT